MRPATPARTAIATAIASLLLSGAAQADPSDEAPPSGPKEGAVAATTRTAGQILGQPMRDIGLVHSRVPDVLTRASANPYALPDGHDCAALGQEIDLLNASLGSDLSPGGRESRVGKLAEAGGRAVVNSIIPFRVVVREVTGAAPAQRRLQEAVELGYARRGFLRGLSQTWGCSTLSVATASPAL